MPLHSYLSTYVPKAIPEKDEVYVERSPLQSEIFIPYVTKEGFLVPSFPDFMDNFNIVFEDGYGRGEGEGMKLENFHPNYNQKPMWPFFCGHLG